MILNSLSPDIKCCIFCGAPNILFNDCGCKRATRMTNALKKVSNYSLLKSLGQCPKCRAVWTPNDLNNHLVLKCQCGHTEKYADIKARLIRKENPVIVSDRNVISCLMNLDYTEQEAKETLGRYYHIFQEYAEKIGDGKECAEAICEADMEAQDASN